MTPEDAEAIYRLRYDAYLREGAVDSRPTPRFTDHYDELPNTASFGVYVEGRLASSIRLSVATPDFETLPANPVFPEFMGPILAAGKIVLDPTRFVVDEDCAKRFPKLPYVTVRIGWLSAEYHGVEVILATVRSEHQAFYKRIFGHKLVCDARPYPTLLKPLSLMMLDYPRERTRVTRRYPFLLSTPQEREALFDPLSSQVAGLRRTGQRMANS